MRGKRKGRGGRRGPESVGDLPSDSPKRKDSKIEFKGLLSHSSRPITNFFHPQAKDQDSVDIKSTVKDSVSTEELKVLSPESNSDHGTCNEETKEVEKIESSEKASLTESLASGELESNGKPGGECPSPPTPHKMILLQDNQPPLLSPTSALSQLTLANGLFKKTAKSRRKLNPSQTANQLAPSAAGSKLTCCSKTKVTSTNEGKIPNTNDSVNGSQHKLTEYFPVRRSIRKTKKIVMEERQRTLEEAVLMCKEDGLQIHNFEGKGRGIVARKLFTKGEFVVEYAGELIKMDEAREREKLYAQDQNTGCYMYYFKYRNQQFCVDATPESDRLGRLVNHSRTGNLMTKTITVENLPRLVLIAKEDIQPGEEVTYDYGDRSKESLKYHPWLAT